MKTASIVPVRLIMSLLVAPRLWAASADATAPMPRWPAPAWQTPAYLRRRQSRDAIRRWP